MPSRLFIKRLELSGFKSFSKKTTFTFDPGLTAVVGPNGCGKSNIIDAVRWVLGEQSARSLRGAKMEELIFHGSEREKAVGMAEVSMTFDNEAGVLSKQGPEINITRRLYRSGESEYLVNKTDVRLKDITEIILDTGISTGAYVIMEQGKIDSILTSRATERMALFEEAAGVMRYQIQKEEAERKLGATQQNLVRVGDIVHELKRQLDSLERQARHAEQYKEMRARATDLKARARAVELSRGAAELAEAEAGVASSRQGLEASRVLVGERQSVLREAREKQETAETAVRELERQVAALREGNQAFHAQLEDVRMAIQQLAVQMKEREVRVAEADAAREKLSVRAARAQEEASQDESQLAKVRQELEEFSAEVVKLEAALEAARQDLAARRQALGTQADKLHHKAEPGTEEAAETGPLAEFKERAPSLEWPLINLFQSDDASRPVVLAALGSLADAAVVETWEQAQAMLSAWRGQREAPLGLVVLEALGDPPARGVLPDGATGWADALVTCAPRHAALARALLGNVAVVGDGALPRPQHGFVATGDGVRVSAPGIVWWPGRLPASASATGTELAMLFAAAVQELGGIEARIVEIESNLVEARRWESAARIEQARIEQRLHGRVGERQSLEQTVAESAGLVERLRTEMRTFATELAARQEELKVRDAERETDRRKQDESTGQLYAAQDELARLRGTLGGLEDELEEARRALETGQQQVLEAEGRASEARTRFELVKHDFSAEFGGELTRLEELATQPLSDEEMAQLQKLERKLEDMGQAVNLLALEEFTSLQERYADYQKQIEDLRKSRESLQRAIYRLDRESERRFEKTFETIRENFHVMFRRLFGGGDADLRLVENEEQERGIEIEAKPPGKKTQSIALLSGGERALVSTALLFSLYMTKPSPFCFLDELDAPLDDANTDRFMKILKEFSGQTQFVMISHNKHTMEMVDSLYGITMEEPGVSKVVSVKLKTLPQAAGRAVVAETAGRG